MVNKKFKTFVFVFFCIFYFCILFLYFYFSVGDRIHAVNGVSIAGLTREEAFDVLLSLGEQQISLAVEHAPEEFAQVKAGKFGDSFYIRSHFAYNRSTTSRGVASQLGNQQQPIELSIRAGDIFHVTDTLFGGSLGYWQATKVIFLN